MDLEGYGQKNVRVETIYGDVLTGLARYEDREYLSCEWGGEEDGLFLGDYLVYRSQIAAIEEVPVHGTAELWTERLILRQLRPEDAEPLHDSLGREPAGSPDPWASPEAARETVERSLKSYADERFYLWVMDIEDVVVGTVGACRDEAGRTALGFRVAPGWRGRGLATEAVKKVLEYLTENEGLPRVLARCAAEDGAARA